MTTPSAIASALAAMKEPEDVIGTVAETILQKFEREEAASPYEPAKLKRCTACGGSGLVKAMAESTPPLLRLGPGGDYARDLNDWPRETGSHA